jgi:hypothetical protein
LVQDGGGSSGIVDDKAHNPEPVRKMLSDKGKNIAVPLDGAYQLESANSLKRKSPQNLCASPRVRRLAAALRRYLCRPGLPEPGVLRPEFWRFPEESPVLVPAIRAKGGEAGLGRRSAYPSQAIPEFPGPRPIRIDELRFIE